MSNRILQQAIEYHAGFVDEGAAHYEEYLDGPYRSNRIRNKPGWDVHFKTMDRVRETVLQTVLEQGNLTLEELNMLFVGGGPKPRGGYLVDRERSGFFLGEISPQSMKRSMRHLKTIVYADISQNIVRRGIENLVEGGIDPKVLLGAQLDITRGRAAIYEMQLRKWEGRIRKNPTQALDDIEALAAKLRSYKIERLDEKLLEAIAEYQERVGDIELPDPRIPGGINESRGMQYSVAVGDEKNVEPLPIHLGVFSMLNAGTGAPAEGKYLWNLLNRVTGQPEHLKDPHILQIRRSARIAFHDWITRYNTYVTIESARTFFADNIMKGFPPHVLLIITDANTQYQGVEGGQPIGLLPRLDCSEVQRKLAGIGEPVDEHVLHIETVVDSLGLWRDEENKQKTGHGHQVMTMVMQPKPPNGKRKVYPMAPLVISDQPEEAV